MLALRGPQYVMATELDEIKSILASDVDEDEEADLSALDKIKTKAKEMSSRTVLLPILIMMLMLTLQVCHFFYFISNYRYISSNAIMSVLMYVLEKKLECWNSVVCNRCLYYGLDWYIFSLKIVTSFQPLSGSDSVCFYSLDIFRRANVKMNNYVLSILVNSGFTLGYMISAMIMTSVGRKLQFISSGLFMAVSLATLGFTLDAEVFQIQIFFKTFRKDFKLFF